MAGLFLFLGQAVAGPRTTSPAGTRQAIVLFATGKDAVEADHRARRKALWRGWRNIQIEQTTPLNVGADGIDDPELRAAAEQALQDGASLLLYDARNGG